MRRRDMSERARSLRPVGTIGSHRLSPPDRVSPRRALHPLLIALIGCVAGCATPAPPPGDRGMRLVTEASVEAARRLWASTGITHYEYSPKCTGRVLAKGRDGSYPLVVVTQGTHVKSYAFDGFLNLTSATTLDGIFDEMRRILAFPKYRSGTVDFEVEFHPTWGYPVRLYLGDTDLFDSFEHCTITHVRRLADREVPRTSQRR